MKRLLKYSAIFAAILCFVSSCDLFKDDALDTDQYSSLGVTLSSFGPNPVVRGSALTILGSNLQDVAAVQIPGVGEISNIEVVTTGAHSAIKVIVPLEGPTVGPISIKTKDGNIIKAESDLTYTEGIEFDSFSPAAAMPGDVITIQGEYLYNVQEVYFAGGACSKGVNIISKSRHELKVVVPDQAITGKFYLSDVDSELDPDAIAGNYYSPSELAIGDPSVEAKDYEAYKAGSLVEINGEYLKMIKTIKANGATLEEFEGNSDGTALYFYLPDTVTDGDLTVVSFAGKEFKVGTITTIIPTDLKAAPVPVKADQTLTITGTDLDLVTGIDLSGKDGAEFAFADGAITLSVPTTATDGDAVLKLANGKCVSVAYTLVKPTVTAIAPLELMAGEKIVVKGTDLDLITEATLGGKAVEYVFANDGSELTITTANTSVSGKIVLKLANGTTVEPQEDIQINYDSFIIVNDKPAAAHIGAIVTFKGENFMMLENIYIGDAKVEKYVMRADNEIQFVMPYNKIGTYDIKFQLLSGDIETCPEKIEVLLEQVITTAWEGNMDITWSPGQRIVVPAKYFEGVTPGTKIRFYYTQKDQVWAQAQMNLGNWSGGVVFPEIGSNTLVPTDLYGWFSDGILDRITECTLTSDVLNSIIANKAEADGVPNIGLIIQGSDLIFTKIEIVAEIPQEVTIWTGSAYDNWTNTLVGEETDWVNAGLYEGAEIRIYFTADNPTGYQVQTFTGHWGGLAVAPNGTNQFNYDNQPDAIEKGYCHFIATADVVAALTEKQGWGNAIILQANGATFTKVTFF